MMQEKAASSCIKFISVYLNGETEFEHVYVHSPLPFRHHVVMNHTNFTENREGKNSDTHSIPLPQSSKDVEWGDIATVLLLSPARLEIWIIIPNDVSFKFNHRTM